MVKTKKRVNTEIPTIVIDSPSKSDCPHEETSLIVGEKSVTSSPGENVEDRRGSLRRNSISLPNLDDLSVLKERCEVSDYGRSDVSNSENEVSEEEFITPARVRRKSVISPRMLKLMDDASGSNSPANSVTSNNSLGSLLREKIQALPQTFRKKKSPDYKIKIFVGILFITIVVLIVCAYFLYHQKVLQRAYFEKIKLNKDKRIIVIYNDEGVEIIKGRLGTTLNYDTVLNCLPSDQRNDGSICFEWMGRARLYLKMYNLHNDVKCYNLNWIALAETVSPTDCFDFSSSHWYGGGQMMESSWPLERKANHPFQAFVTGRVEVNEWGNVLKRYFINSKGAAIIVDEKTPLYVSIHGPQGHKQMCLRAQYDNFAFVNRLSETAQLNYSICTNSNMSELHSNLADKNIWDGLNKEDMGVINSLLTEPVWEISAADKESLTEETISNFTEEFSNLLILKQGHVLINEFWQNEVGDFEVDTNRFPTLDKTIEMLRRRGFRVVFSIQPFISTESFNFREAVAKRLLISERASDRRIPAITRYKTLESAGVLDVTNNRTVPWLVDKLKKVMTKYNINAYYLDMGIAYNMPHYYQCEKSLINPDTYKTYFTNSLQGSVSLLGVSSAIQRPRSPSFVVLPQFEASWEGMRRVIPTILTYGILGFPFLIPGAVGGDYQAIRPFNPNVNETESDYELYLRWLQMACFLPVIRYNRMPSPDDKKLLDLLKKFVQLRNNKVKPALEKFASTALNTGLPIIRPLWMLDSSDPACHMIEDEFSIGDDLIVAPILYPGSRQREVYLPAGVWKDGIDGSLRKGSRFIHDYRVDEDEIAFFEKMPDDTRF